MKKLILLVGLLILTGCSKEPVAEKARGSEQYVSGVATEQETTTYAEQQATAVSDAKEIKLTTSEDEKVLEAIDENADKWFDENYEKSKSSEHK